MHYTLTARLAIALSTWLLARAGVKWRLEQPRDKRGRFKPRDGGGYGLPRTIPHHVTDLMHDLGISRQMYESAAVPLVLPDDLEDVPALEVCLRMWILRNMDHWVNGKGRSVAPVMHALMCTWAITLFHYKPPKKMLRRFVQIADEAVQREDRHATAVSHRSERFQRVADFEQDLDTSLAAVPTAPTAWQHPEHTELDTPIVAARPRAATAASCARPSAAQRSSAQYFGTYASQGVERPCHSSNPGLCDPLSSSRVGSISAQMYDGGKDAAATEVSDSKLPVKAEPVATAAQQSHATGDHRAPEYAEQDELALSHRLSHPALCLGGENAALPSTELLGAAYTPAGGRRVLPYDPNSIHGPDPPWYSPPPHPPPTPHGTLKTGT